MNKSTGSVSIPKINQHAVLEVNVDDQNFGGVFSLVKNVIEHNKSGIRIDIAAIEPFDNSDNLRILNSAGCRVFQIGAQCNKLIKQIRVFKNLKQLLKKEGFSCVHIHADTANKLLVSGLASKKCNVKKIIFHSHSSGIDGNHRFIKLIAHRLCRRFLKCIGTDFVSCSDLAARWMFPNVAENKVTIINNGITLTKYRFNREIRDCVRSELHIADALLIGHVGRFNYQKNHEYIIRIMKSVSEKAPTAKLLLVGTGENQTDIRNLAQKLGLLDRVIFFGTSEHVNELMQAMDVFILPSRFEGLPIVGVEAQASGLPVIFSDAITRKANLTDNISFLPITDEAVNLWADTILDEAKKTINRVEAYSVLENKGFDISSTVNSFLTLYKDI